MTNEEAMGILYSHSRINPKIGCEQRFIAYQNGDVEKALDIAIQSIGKTTWIPCSERLPEEREWYLAVFKEKDTAYQLIPRVADYIGKGENKWQIIDEGGLVSEYRGLLECVAWMPLPESYKGE